MERNNMAGISYGASAHQIPSTASQIALLHNVVGMVVYARCLQSLQRRKALPKQVKVSWHGNNVLTCGSRVEGVLPVLVGSLNNTAVRA